MAHHDKVTIRRRRMWSESNGTAGPLLLAGFLSVVLAYAMYAAQLWRVGLLQASPPPGAGALIAAVSASLAWGASALAALLTRSDAWAHAATLCDQLRYVAWTLFMLALLPAPSRGRAIRSYALLAWGLFALGVAANAAVLLSDGPAQPAVRALVASQLTQSVLGLVMLEQLFRNQTESTRWAAKPLCIGLAIVFAFDVYLFSQATMFGGFDRDAIGARAFVHALAVPLLLLALRRNARWTARIRVSKSAAFYSASLLLVGSYLMFVAAAGYYVKYFGGSWGGTMQVALLAAALAALIALAFSGAVRARLRVFLSKHFFSYRYDYRLEWLRFTTMLSSKSTPQEVGPLVIRGLADMVECPAGSLWYLGSGDSQYVQFAVWNAPRSTQTISAMSDFCRFMREREWIVALDPERGGASHVSTSALPPPGISDLDGAWAVVPLLVAGDLAGFVVLAKPRTQIDLNWEVRDLLKTAARQAAGYLALMHATEALLEVRKFDAFNRMSAFVVHDLKNIVTQLSLMLKNAQRHRDNPEFQSDMLITVENSLERMRQMMAQLREGERPTGLVVGVDLPPLLRRIHAAAQHRGRQVEIQIIDHVATRGHEQRLERVIGHVVQNALDATPPTGRVWVRLSQAAGSAVLTVGDTGAGMTKDFIERGLFRPFSSTKNNGMGIGAYESFQYVKELGGRIDVDSEVGRGSTITLSLPLFDSRSRSDLHPARETE